MEDLVLSCLESRVEENRNLYARFLIGPFFKGDALTVATALRRVLLSSVESVSITALYIQGITHEFCNIAGVRESVLELSLNFQSIVLCYDKSFFQKKSFFDDLQIGYLQVQGPKIVYANDLKLPLGVKVVSPTQYLATISREGVLVIKFTLGKTNNLLNQNSSFHNPSPTTKQVISQQLLKKNVVKAKRNSSYKSIYTKNNNVYIYPSIKRFINVASSPESKQYFFAKNGLAVSHRLRAMPKRKNVNKPNRECGPACKRCTAFNCLRLVRFDKRSCKSCICMPLVNTYDNGLGNTSFARDVIALPTIRDGEANRRFRNKDDALTEKKITSTTLNLQEYLHTVGNALGANSNHTVSHLPFCNAKSKKQGVAHQSVHSLWLAKIRFALHARRCTTFNERKVRHLRNFQGRFASRLQTRRDAFYKLSLAEFFLNPKRLSLALKKFSTRSVFLYNENKSRCKLIKPIKQKKFSIFNSNLFINQPDSYKKVLNSLWLKKNSRFKDKVFKSEICLRNIIPLDTSLPPVLKVNFVVEIDDEVLYLRQKMRERIILEVWTNGSIHPRQAVHDATLSLLDIFSTFRSLYQINEYSSSILKVPGYTKNNHLHPRGQKRSTSTTFF